MPQTIFPLTPAQIASPTVNYNWTDIDLSAYIPVGATGIFFRVFNGDAGVRPWGVRMNGSTDNRLGDMSGLCHCWGMIGVDANRRIEFNNQTGFPGKIGMDIVGYTMPGVTFRTNGVAIPGGLVWTTVNLSTYLPADAIGAIFEVKTAIGTGWCVRTPGSTDAWVAGAGNAKNQFGAICGCDNTQSVEFYRNWAGTQYYLLGYITEGATFYLNAVNITPPVVGAWTLCPNPLPVTSVMAFVTMAQMTGRGGLGTYPTPDVLTNVISRTLAFARPDVGGRLIGYVAGAGNVFYLRGYGGYSAHTVQTGPATAITEEEATLNGVLSDDGGEACDCGFEYGETIAYGTTTPTQSKTSGRFFSRDITGLSSDTVYHFRAIATNSGGISYGNDMTFLTGPSGSPSYWYHLNVRGVNLPYEDLDGTKELHMILKNLSPTIKEAGADGEVKVKIDYEPAA